MVKRVVVLLSSVLGLALAAFLLVGSPADAHNAEFRTKLRDPDGRVVGTVEFRISRHATRVTAELRPNPNVEAGAFHGFHVHANDVPSNGDGCRADPSLGRDTWFVSADGHLPSLAPGTTHGAHAGDLPSPLVLADGTARLEFTTDRISPKRLRNTAVVLHARPDNFGNVPVGSLPNQYSANGAAAGDLTSRTGNAGDRVACGVLRRTR